MFSTFLLFACVFVYGIGATLFFQYAILMTGIQMFEGDPELFVEEPDTLDVWIKAVKMLGVLRICVWLIVALLWLPALVLVVLFMFAMPDAGIILERMLTWFFLGFGTLPKKTDEAPDIPTLS